MKLLWIPAFAGMTLLSGVASAQHVYKCRDAQGHMKYSQSPCHDAPQAPAKPVAAPVEEPATPQRTEKASPEQRAQDAPAPKADPDVDKPLVDSMGRPDVTRMSAPPK